MRLLEEREAHAEVAAKLHFLAALFCLLERKPRAMRLRTALPANRVHHYAMDATTEWGERGEGGA